MLHRSSRLRVSRVSRVSRIAVVVPLAMLGVVLGAASCDDGTHVYSASQYDPAHQCLGPAQTLDVVSGGDPGSGCALKCLVSTSGGGAIYVSSQCPPYPPLFDTSGAQTGCDEALAAGERGDTCLGDGGSSHPPPDGGGGGDAGGSDASSTDSGDSGGDATPSDASTDGNATDT